MAAYTVQEQTRVFVQDSMQLVTSLQQAVVEDSRYEIISTSGVDGLLQRIHTFVNGELKQTRLPEAEKRRLNAELQSATQMLEGCKSLINKFGPEKIMQAITDKPVSYGGYVNLAYNAPAVMPSTGFIGRSCVPLIGYYGRRYYTEARAEFTYRLHPAQAQNFPASLQGALAGRDPEKLDLFFKITPGYGALYQDTKAGLGKLRYNLVTHFWAFPKARLGETHKQPVQMGIYEPVGISEEKTKEGIPFNTLKPLEVYLHPTSNPHSIAISPNNAHFRVTEEAPVSAFWYVAMYGDRTVVVREWLLNNQEHPFTQLIHSSFDRERETSIKEQIERLKHGKADAIAASRGRFEEIATAFESGNAVLAMQRFSSLAQGEKNRIYFHAWKQRGEQQSSYPNFGKGSFENAHDLAAKHHCTTAQRAAAVRGFFREQTTAFEKILNDYEALYSTPSSIPVKSQEHLRRERLVTPIIELLKKRDDVSALQMVDALADADKRKIFELSRVYKLRPSGDVAANRDCYRGAEHLPIYDKCGDAEDRIQVLNLFAHHLSF